MRQIFRGRAVNMKVKDVKTDPTLLQALKQSSRKLSPEETLQQRVSFVYGTMKSNNALTKEQVKKAILEEG